MKDVAIEQLYACAAKVIESLKFDLSEEQGASARKDTVAMLQKLANLLLQLNKLQTIYSGEDEFMPLEDREIIEEFLRKHRDEPYGT